jgi:hypothetical protein
MLAAPPAAAAAAPGWGASQRIRQSPLSSLPLPSLRLSLLLPMPWSSIAMLMPKPTVCGSTQHSAGPHIMGQHNTILPVSNVLLITTTERQ